MAKRSKNTVRQRPLTYERVVLADVRKRRRGKHHELLHGIFDDLLTLPAGSALKIPLAAVNGISLANLRSAVHREAMSREVEIETLSDADHFYLWKPAK